MITQTDALNTIEFAKYYVILPSMPLWDVTKFAAAFDGAPCVDGFTYSSASNSEWLTVEQIRELITTHLDPEFVPAKTPSSQSTGRLVLHRGAESVTRELEDTPEPVVTTL
jgi:hypothetical protein